MKIVIFPLIQEPVLVSTHRPVAPQHTARLALMQSSQLDDMPGAYYFQPRGSLDRNVVPGTWS